MTPLFFLSILCLGYGGVEDCNYTWEILPLDQFPKGVGGYQHENAVYAVNLEILLHEIKHLKCKIQFSDPTELKLCNFGVDLEYTKQSVRPDFGWHGITDNSPPEISQKMAYTKQGYAE